MSEPQTTLARPKMTLIQKCKTMRGQQMVCTVAFLIAPLLLLFTFTYLPFFKMVQFSFYDRDYLRVRDFVGLRNYLDVFSRSDCFQALKLSLYYRWAPCSRSGWRCCSPPSSALRCGAASSSGVRSTSPA